MTNWQTKTIKDITTLIKDGTHGTHKDVENGIPLLSAKDISAGKVNVAPDSRVISKADFNAIHARYSLKDGDILLTIVGSLGRVAIVTDYANNYTFQRSVAILRFNNEVATSYAYYYLTSAVFQKELLKRESKGAQGGVYLGDISKIKIHIPEKLEQERIVGVLEVWDEYIEKLEQKIALKEQLKKGLMQQLLTGKRRLPGFNDEWQEFRLHELTKSSSLRNRDLFVDRVLSVTNKRGFVLPSDHFSKVVASDNLSNYKIVKKGEFAYNPSRINVGSIDLLTSYDAGVLSPMYVVFKTTKDLDSEFLKYWLQTARAKANIENAGSGSVRQSVDFKDFGSMKIVIPSVEEQRSIVSALNVIRLQIEQITKLKDLVKLQKKYLLRNLITGAIRTPEDLQPLDTSRLERSAL